jgi:hypothetical protein
VRRCCVDGARLVVERDRRGAHLAAIEEYEARAKRRDYLVAQKTDLETARCIATGQAPAPGTYRPTPEGWVIGECGTAAP